MSVCVDRVFVAAIRFLCLAVFLLCSVSVTAQSVAAALVLLASVFLIQPTKTAIAIRTRVLDITKVNPFRRKLDPSHDLVVPAETVAEFQRLLAESLTYDATDVDALRNFEVVKSRSQCVFAKTARLWGSADYQRHLSLEENIRRSFATFLKFSCFCEVLALDGFVFEFPGDIYGQSVEKLGEAVWKLVSTLSQLDPIKRRTVAKADGYHGNIERRNWVFELNRVTFFITTFAPCYPSSNSRFSFDASNAYVLLQPEISFAKHNLPPDTPETNWNRPLTIRDQIRVAFRDAGRPYAVRETVHYPMAWDIVKPLHEGGDLVKWWQAKTDHSGMSD